MLFTKLLLSPMPHARVRSIDTTAALAMPGVKAILTADDLPDLERRRARAHERAAVRRRADPRGGGRRRIDGGRSGRAHPGRSRAAAVRDRSARQPAARRPERAARRQRLGRARAWRPGARRAGAARRRSSGPAEDFAAAEQGRLPMGKALEEWSYGDLDAGFAAAALVLDETFVAQSTGAPPDGNAQRDGVLAERQAVHPRVHAERGADARQHRALGRHRADRRDADLPSTRGGGFGSKGGGAVSMSIPALLSKKANAPVMMRITREEESYIGRARTNMTGRARVGFAKDGRITALDLFIVQDTGAYGPLGDHRSAGLAASLIYQPPAMRWRAVNVITNTPPRSQQRSPGPMQANGIVEPVITQGRQAARHRPGGDPPDELAGRQGAVRSGAAERPAQPRHERVREGGARSRRGGLQLGRAQGARRAAAGIEGARRRRRPSDRTARARSAGTAS